MFTDFQHHYATLSNDELLRLAADRLSLTDEARIALDAEMQNRRLTVDDLAKHERLVKRAERREATQTKRKLFGSRRDRVDGIVTLFWSILAVSLILTAYLALPARYHFPSQWQEAATDVMFGSVFVVAVAREWWRRTLFWVSLVISSGAHALILHAWIVWAGADTLYRSIGSLAMLIGPILFLVVYACGYLLHKTFRHKDVVSNP